LLVIRQSIRVAIVYAQPRRSIGKSLLLSPGATIADALAEAAQDQDFLGVDLANSPVGIFGKVARRDVKLNDGDRIEIYRPLGEEPKLARRERASRKASKPVRS
jgi:putative ubiquitin-RnfH superfamily antitoxin RatB of RatAB toxin-antitoxin module